MPIVGLSERRRLPRLGSIKLGVMVQPSGPGKKPYPKATDYLVVPPEVAAVHGEQPRELPIMFPVNDPAVLFPQDLKMYRASGLWCKGNAVVAHRWDDRGELAERPCPCDFLDEGKCKPVATLNFFLPDVPGVGVWQITTSNKSSIVSLNSALETFAGLFTGLAGIPFTLKLEPEQVQRFDDDRKAMVATTIHVLRLDSALSLADIIRWRQGHGKAMDALLPPAEPQHEEPRALPETTDPSPNPGAPPLAPGAGCESALPGAGGPSASAPRGKIGDTDPEHPWDLSLCFATAKKIGVETEDYERYLFGVYRCAAADLSDQAVREQAAQLRDAAASPLAGDTLKKAMLAVARKVAEGKVVQARGAEQGNLLR